MQSIYFIGNLTKDPELRTTQSGVNVCSFTVAVDRRGTGDNKVTDYFRVNAWRALAENCHKYLSKGKKVFVTGELQARTYESNGKTNMSLDVMANGVEFLSQADGKQPKQEPKEEEWTTLNTSDLPF